MYILGFVPYTVENPKTVEINNEMTELNFFKSNGRTYISGNMIILEWVNGSSKNLGSIPEVYLRSKDGSSTLPVYIKYLGNSKYYFDSSIDEINELKEYELYLKIRGSEYYTTTGKDVMIAKFNSFNGKSFETDTMKLNVSNNALKVEKKVYKRDIFASLKTFEVKNIGGRDYITGEINVYEKIGDERINYTKDIKMYLKSENETHPIFVSNNGNSLYYFDRNITRI